EATVPAGAVGQVISVAGRFGLVAAAGELAILYGILPWPKGEALRAAKTCFKAWLAERGGSATEVSEDTRAIERVREAMSGYGESRFTLIEGGTLVDGEDGRIDSKSRTARRLGFRRATKDGDTAYMFTTEGWNEVCAGLDAVRVAQLMEKNDWLVKGSEKDRL